MEHFRREGEERRIAGERCSECPTDKRDSSITVRVCAHSPLRSYRPNDRASLIGFTIPNMRDFLTQFSTSLTLATRHIERIIHFSQ